MLQTNQFNLNAISGVQDLSDVAAEKCSGGARVFVSVNSDGVVTQETDFTGGGSGSLTIRVNGVETTQTFGNSAPTTALTLPAVGGGSSTTQVFEGTGDASGTFDGGSFSVSGGDFDGTVTTTPTGTRGVFTVTS